MGDFDNVPEAPKPAASNSTEKDVSGPEASAPVKTTASK